MGFLRRGSHPLSQLKGMGSAVSSPAGSGRSPGRQAVLPHLKYIARKASPDTSVVLLLLKTGSHRSTRDYCQKLLTLDTSHCLIQFSVVNLQHKIVPRFQLILRASRVVIHNEFDFTVLEKMT